jgi:hypothetical protein
MVVVGSAFAGRGRFWHSTHAGSSSYVFLCTIRVSFFQVACDAELENVALVRSFHGTWFFQQVHDGASVSRTFIYLLLGALVGASPVWIWNMMNDYASFKFQVDHGLGRRWKPSWTYEYIGAQVALVFPIILYWALRAKRSLPPVFHLWAWVPLVFFLFTTSRGYVEANWPIAAYPVIFALAASQYPMNRRGLSITCWIWGILLSALAIVIVAQPSWSIKLKVREFHQFDRLVEVGSPLQPLFARSYQMASKLHFELRRPVYKLKGMNRRDFFDYLEPSKPRTGVYY